MSQRLLSELPPALSAYPDVEAWAKALSEFLRRDALAASGKATEITRLYHLDTSTARSTQNGIVVYDPVLNKLAVTVAGVWRTYSPDP